MLDSAKIKLLECYVNQHITIIEGDICSNLYFGLSKPRSIYSFDTAGAVILCSSFSKFLSRDLWLGWILPGKHIQKVKQLKIFTSIATGMTTQKELEMYLEQGCYEQYIKKQRSTLEIQSIQLQEAIK